MQFDVRPVANPLGLGACVGRLAHNFADNFSALNHVTALFDDAGQTTEIGRVGQKQEAA